MKRAIIVTALIAMVCLFTLIGLPVCVEAGVVTTLVVREKAGVTTTNYPLTFGHVFKKGTIPAGEKANVAIGPTVLTTQFDQKSSWPDGSVRHAVISVVVPQVKAGQDLLLTLESGGGNTNTGELTKQQILDTGVVATINLTGISGSGYTGNLTADLRAAITAQTTPDYWLKGAVCTEILVNQPLNNSLNATWEVRAYPGTPYMRISHAVENVNLQSRGNISYALSINQGGGTPAQVYSKATFQHNHSSRWRKVFWVGAAPPEVEIRYDLPYMISTGMVMPYDTSLTVPESAITSMVSTWQGRGTDLYAELHIPGTGYMSGLANMTFGATGGRPEIGVLPKWAAMYLLSMDNRVRDILLWHGEMSGWVPIHYRESDPTKTFFGRPASIDDRPTISIGTTINTQFPPIGTLTSPWGPDRAHQGSFAYLPYLITGEKWFLDEVRYWAGYNLIYHEYFRDGNGSHQNFSAGKNGSFGGLYEQLRGVAWALRNISDAALVLSDDGLEGAYYSQKVKNNLDWLTWGNSPGTTAHGLGAVRHQREQGKQALGNHLTSTAPWMHDFLVLVLSDMVRKESHQTTARTLRDQFGAYTVGRFTNDPTFPRFEGAGYWWPLSDGVGNYFTDKDWGRYWLSVAETIGRNPGQPNTSFAGNDYSYSYAAIALGANSQLLHLSKGKEAYDFLKSNLSYNAWAPADPTWAFRVYLPPAKNLKIINKN